MVAGVGFEPTTFMLREPLRGASSSVPHTSTLSSFPLLPAAATLDRWEAVSRWQTSAPLTRHTDIVVIGCSISRRSQRSLQKLDE